MTGSNFELRYYFDPLCGWCYASAPSLAGLAECFPDQLSLMPSGLFMHARPVADMADHAWRNDRHIAELTGQRFSEDYHCKVLLAPQGVFDSAPLTFALVALGEVDHRIELRFLHAAQIARYVDGRDTSRIEVAADVAVAVAADAGTDLDRVAFAQYLGNAELQRRVAKRVAAAQADLEGFPSRGVPQLLLVTGAHRRLLDGHDLYAGRDVLLERIDQLLLTA